MVDLKHREWMSLMLGAAVGGFVAPIVFGASNLNQYQAQALLGAVGGGSAAATAAGYNLRKPNKVLVRYGSSGNIVIEKEGPLKSLFFQELPFFGGPWQAYEVDSAKVKHTQPLTDGRNFFVELEPGTAKIRMRVKVVFNYHIIDPLAFLDSTDHSGNLKVLFETLAGFVQKAIQSRPYLSMLSKNSLCLPEMVARKISEHCKTFGIKIDQLFVSDEELPGWFVEQSEKMYRAVQEGKAFEAEQGIMVKALDELLSSPMGTRLCKEYGFPAEGIAMYGLVGTQFLESMLAASSTQGLFSESRFLETFLSSLRKPEEPQPKNSGK